MHRHLLIVAVFIVLLLTVSSCAPSAAAPPNVATAPATVTPASTETAPLPTPTSVQPANTPPLAVSTSTSVPPATAAATQAATSAVATPAAQGTAEQQVIVEMKDYAFVPKSISVATGATVVWRNDDATTHTVTADNKLFDSGDMSQGAQFKYVFTKPGVYPYYCVWHGGPSGQGMSGTVTVK